MKIQDVFTGGEDAGHVLLLAEQLKLIPTSRYRAIWLGGLEFIGWDIAQHTRASTYDVLAGIGLGLGGKQMTPEMRHPRPTSADDVKATLVAPTIAEFNIPEFFERMST